MTTDFVSHADALPGIGASPQLMDAVFNEPDKAPADVVQVPQGYVVFQLLAVRPPATPTFEQIRSRVETEFKNQRAGFLLQQKTQELSDRAKADHDLKKAAKDRARPSRPAILLRPTDRCPDRSVDWPGEFDFLAEARRHQRAYHFRPDGAVAQLLEKQAPTDQEFAAKKDEIRQWLLEEKQNEMFQLFVSNLRKNMEKSNRLKVNEDEMKNFTRQAGAEEGS